jgi:Spy/CpxP family protein refolding chaperone
MRTLFALMIVAGALAAVPGLLALDPAPRQQALGVLAEHVQDLNLTDQQEAKIMDIRKEYQPKVLAAAKDLAAVVKEEEEKARAILTDAQKTKLAALKDERKQLRAERLTHRLAHLEELDLTDAETTKIAAIREEYQPKIAKAMEALRGLLTDDQRKAREQALMSGKKRMELVAALNLTGFQKEQVEAVGKQVRALIHQEMEKIHDVLNEGQQTKLEEFKEERKEHVRDRMAHRIVNFKALDLTSDQISKLESIRKEYRPKVHEAGNKLRAIVREEVRALVSVLKA